MLASMTDKGQVTVPKDIRDRLGIAAGSKLDFEVQDDGTILVRVLVRGAGNLFGIVRRPGMTPQSIDAMDEGIAAAVKARNRRSRA